MMSKDSKQVKRAKRKDGENTKNIILEVAGKLFAEQGFDNTTSKDICAKAGANIAAVNYYFGSREALLDEVIVLAHRRFIDHDNIAQIMSEEFSPELKLRKILDIYLSTAFEDNDKWATKLVVREILSSSVTNTKILEEIVKPNIVCLHHLIHELTGLEPFSDASQRAIAFVFYSSFAMTIIPKAKRERTLPAITSEYEVFLDEMLKYCLAGLNALKS